MFGIRGAGGSLTLEPKLEPEQFDGDSCAAIQCPFGGEMLTVVYHNPREAALRQLSPGPRRSRRSRADAAPDPGAAPGGPWPAWMYIWNKYKEGPEAV